MMLETAEQLTDKEQEIFQEVVNELLAATFVLKEEFSSKTGRLVPNPAFSFIERKFPAFRQLFASMGWEISINDYQGYAMVTNPFGGLKARLNMLQTYFLYTLRYIYEEKQNDISLDKGVTCSVRDVLIKMIEVFHLASKRPSKAALDETVQILKKFRIIDSFPGEEWNRTLIIYPTIYSVVTAEKIKRVQEELAKRENVGHEESAFGAVLEEEQEDLEL
jgi:hypothetical protein